MKTSDIILLPFPFAELTNRKVRPAVVVCITKDQYQDIVVCAISSVVPAVLSDNEIILQPDSTNSLRKVSVLKTDRIVTAQQKSILSKLGELGEADQATFRKKFRLLIE